MQLKPWGVVLGDYYQQMCAEGKPFKVLEGLWTSMVLVQDLTAIKDIMITQFENFPDRGFYVNHKDALSLNLVRLDYKLWKPLRQKLSPSFSPAKLRSMFPTLSKVGEQLVTVLREECGVHGKSIEIYDLCSRFTTDIIGNVAFGMECNSLSEPNTEFRQQGDRAFYNLLHPFVDMFGAKYPQILRLLNVKAFGKESNEFFKRVFKENLEYREKNNIRRQDFMDLLIDLKNEHHNNKELPMTLELLVGQTFAFFIGGFETSSSTMAYALYEMAKNGNNQTFTYECLKGMRYLKTIIQETLRKYPVAPAIPRVCRRTCTLKTSQHSSLTLQEGTTVIIPIYGIQHNSQLYPEPEKFAPERFANDEENAKRDPCSFLAFGAGPKICIGEQFGRLQMTLGLAIMLSEFKFSVCSNTPEELHFDPKNMFVLAMKNGIVLKIEKYE
ncbi:cytochrome P450 6a22 [Stomoxys calcitrans]|uniref:cytochrome P450 6a22 n=1 Tax=Stomoxys calcitrans TaxID=35570 RepID=UPI0027E3601F|nr:cytochrome P450 6a22 [Stomoxys calcitrans]